MLSNEIRLETFKVANEKQAHFLCSSDATAFYTSLQAKYQISNKKLFLITLGDIILGFYKIEDTVPLLQQELELDPKTAAALGAEVLTFLAPLSDPNWEPPVDETAEGEDVTEGDSSSENAAQGEAISIPITTSVRIPLKSPSFITAPKPLHTFASDMEAVRETPTELETATPAASPSPSLSSVPIIPTPQTQPEPAFSSSQPTVTREPLSSIPSYTPSPTQTPTNPVAEATPAPDRPRWSTDV